MGNYISTTDVRNRLRKSFEPLYTPRGWTSEDEDCVDADIDAAEANLHSYLAGRYEVPVTDGEAVKLLKHWALVLLQEIAYGAIPGREMEPSVAAQVKSVRDRLERIAEGHLSLGTATELETTDGGFAGEFISDGPDPVFARDDLKGF